MNDLHNIKYESIRFNFEEFFDLNSKTDEAAHRIADKEIMILIGNTGVGKSTNI